MIIAFCKSPRHWLPPHTLQAAWEVTLASTLTRFQSSDIYLLNAF